MSGNTVIEQEVFVEDKEKMAEFELKLKNETEQMKAEAEIER